VYCTDADAPWYGDCCRMLSTCYHVCHMDKDVCDRIFDKCAQGMCDALSAAEDGRRCVRHLRALLAEATGDAGCGVYLHAQEEACACMHDEL
jgi:hypothetical protein